MKMKVAKKLLWLANLVLAVLVVAAAVRVLGERGAAGTVDDNGNTPLERPPDPLSQPLTDTEAREMLASGNIVPLPPPPPAPPPRETDTPPQPVDIASAFGYALVGTVVEDNFAWAFFADKGGRQIGAGQGDKVGAATVVGIYEDRVLIEMRGKREYINIEKEFVVSAAPVIDIASRRGLPVISIQEPPVVTGEDEGEGEEGEEEEEEYFDELDWNVIPEDLYKDYVTNVGKYISEIVILAHYDENKQADGLLLSKVPKTSEAYKRGLRQGDIVKSLQDTPVADTTTAFRVASQVLRDEEYLVDLVIVRDGKEEMLSYEIWPE